MKNALDIYAAESSKHTFNGSNVYKTLSNIAKDVLYEFEMFDDLVNLNEKAIAKAWSVDEATAKKMKKEAVAVYTEFVRVTKEMMEAYAACSSINKKYYV
jgi:hypothetical protein